MYIKRDKVRIKRKALNIHDVIADSRKVVLFVYEMPFHLKLEPCRGVIYNMKAVYCRAGKRIAHLTERVVNRYVAGTLSNHCPWGSPPFSPLFYFKVVL